ncbi:MAG: heavy-metal-associated domain-containing protein [Muribaculaceae bacterium]|nr:heavy-metal-associated domain-containing protein [Muribaculaceae bacterium]
MTENTFSISGMKCVNCKAKVEAALNDLNGVDSAVASLEDANVTVIYDDTQVTPAAMKEAVDDLGRFEMEI